jgi:hypothetical protein
VCAGLTGLGLQLAANHTLGIVRDVYGPVSTLAYGFVANNADCAMIRHAMLTSVHFATCDVHRPSGNQLSAPNFHLAVWRVAVATGLFVMIGVFTLAVIVRLVKRYRSWEPEVQADGVKGDVGDVTEPLAQGQQQYGTEQPQREQRTGREGSAGVVVMEGYGVPKEAAPAPPQRSADAV